MTVYLDYNATAPVRPEVAARVAEVMALAPLNPSSVHSKGREAKRILEDSRNVIAEAISAWPREILFTASATEANATALRGFPDRRVIVSAIEHSSILNSSPLEGERAIRGAQHRRGAVGGTPPDSAGALSGLASSAPPQGGGMIPVEQNGVVNLLSLESLLLESKQPTLVSVMLANNETGVIQPIAEISALCKKHHALLHCDAVQGLGKIPVDIGALGVDLMTISAHKMGGVVGAAALVVRDNIALQSLFPGAQESRRRAGTENVAAIAGFARAMELVDFDRMKKLRVWLNDLESGIGNQGSDVVGKNMARLPNTSCILTPGISQEVQLMKLDLVGFCVSAGSACSSGRIEPSHVLKAMGYDEAQAGSAIRVSGGWATTEAEIKSFTAAWRELASKAA